MKDRFTKIIDGYICGDLSEFEMRDMLLDVCEQHEDDDSPKHVRKETLEEVLYKVCNLTGAQFLQWLKSEIDSLQEG